MLEDAGRGTWELQVLFLEVGAVLQPRCQPLPDSARCTSHASSRILQSDFTDLHPVGYPGRKTRAGDATHHRTRELTGTFILFRRCLKAEHLPHHEDEVGLDTQEGIMHVLERFRKRRA